MKKNVRKICVVLVDRANYGRMWPVMKEIKKSEALELQTICAGTMLLERFGQAEKIVENEGFKVDGRVYMELEGSVPTTMAKSIGLGVIEFSNEFLRLKPDVVLLIGDRYEALGAVLAAAYMNIPVAHIQGGEVSGSIDESARHAITKFSHLHFPSTERARDYIVRMGENPDFVFNVGCPSGDYIRALDMNLPADLFTKQGVGAPINPEKDFFLVIYHPVTTQYGTERKKVEQLLMALDELKHPTVWLWPNIDAGADDISKALRVYREHHDDSWLHLAKNLDPMTFQKCLKKTACAIGNSSSFIRDSSFSGTPVVLVGGRQIGREIAENVTTVLPEKDKILETIRSQVKHGRYAPSQLYGTGTASKMIVEKLTQIQSFPEKRLHFVYS